MNDTAWDRQLDRLQGNISTFVERFVGELRRRALYDPESVSEDDLMATAEQTFLMLVDRLRDGSSVLDHVAITLGRNRARQGVPLERLIDAIRLDLRIIWQLLREQAGPDGLDVLVDHVERLMAVVDGYVGDVQQAFLAEVAILQRDSRVATEQHLSRLFNAQSLDATLLDDIAAGIGVDPKASFELVLMPNALEESRRGALQPWLARREVFAYVYRGWLLLFRALGETRSSWAREFHTLPAIYVREVSGLCELPVAARAALELQASAKELRRLTEIDEYWAVGAAKYLHELIPGYFPPVEELLAEVGDDERARLLRTVQEYLDSGSIKTTTEIVGCHRNTVINRFKLFQSLTGYDITVPAQAAFVYVMLFGASGETTGQAQHHYAG